jgi:hypothetical protein
VIEGPSEEYWRNESVKRREELRPVLDAELKKWEAKSVEQLLAELTEVQAYETEFEKKRYQVEVDLLENTEKYVHVGMAVDDGSFLAVISPLSTSFIREKE